jgi:hypothetical protein
MDENMGTCHWVCQGIGVEHSNILPLLDADKLKVLFVDISEDEWESEYNYSALAKEEKIDAIMECIDCSDFCDKLPELLQQKDDRGVLETGNDNDGLYFLLYSPRYPWEESGGFTSQDEVVKYFYDLIRPFCRDDVTEGELLAVIDEDIYAYGCG